MKTIAAIIMATTTPNPQQVANLPATHMVQNSPQIQNMHLNAIVPTICNVSKPSVVEGDAVSIRIQCNTSSALFLRIEEHEQDKMLPLNVQVLGNQPMIVTKNNIIEYPIAELDPIHITRDMRIRILAKGGRLTDLGRVQFIIRPTGI